MIFDTHAHYMSRRFDGRRGALLAGLPAQGVCGVLECATHSGDAPACIRLAEEYDWVWAAVGIHPESLIEDDAATVAHFHGAWRAALDVLEPLLTHPKVVAVGEIGLDYHWPVPKDAQQALFEAQLELAAAHGLPVSIHDREAHAPMYDALRRHRPRGVLHCYSGSADDAVWLTKQGLYLGFGGTLTFKNARKTVEAAAACPIDRLLLETDCPYMAPEPFRGKENNSALLIHVAQKLAEIKRVSVDEILRVTEENARRLFGV